MFVNENNKFKLDFQIARKMLNYLILNTSKRWIFDCMVNRTYCHALYTQGQRAEKKIREYFYYIDHEGMVNKHFLFLKTACFSCSSSTDRLVWY